MEEKKEVKTETKEKMSYEQLNNAAIELSNQNRKLYMELEKAKQIINTFSELDYLFRVVEFKNSFSKEFAEMCISEIEKIMTPKKEEIKE